MLRRIGSLKANAGLAVLVRAVWQSNDADEQLTIVARVRNALAGQRRVKAAGRMGGRLFKAFQKR